MLYLLDENVFINAERDVYPSNRIPEFWRWLLHHIRQRQIGSLKRISSNLKQTASPERPEDALSLWIRDHEAEMSVKDPPADVVRRVLKEGYEQPTNSTLFAQIQNDPFLIAAALVAPTERVVVTMESSDRRARKGLKRHIPHVCQRVGVRSATLFDLIRELNFHTADWRRSP